MGNQMLPSIPAASSLRLKNVYRSLSTVWNYSPGWAEKRQSAKECHLDSTQCPPICHDCTAQQRHTLQKCQFFVVHYKLLLLKLFFVMFFVMLRNTLVAFRVVLSRILVHVLSSTNNLAVSENSSLHKSLHLLLQYLFCFTLIGKLDIHILINYPLLVRTQNVSLYVHSMTISPCIISPGNYTK